MRQSDVQPAKTVFMKPLLGGNYADPSVIRVGGDYYMTHTSYKHVPGLIVWHSRDLVHWEPIAAALSECVGDVWAPDFVHYRGMYYIYFPAARTNWVVTSPSPYGPWSKPIDLRLRGIDPGHVVGPDGKRYLYISGVDLVELSEDGLSVASGPRRVYEGWSYPEHWEVEAFSLEGPKATRKDGYYYLTSAEGGTAGPPTSHMVVSARSRYPWGPWEHSPYNPVVRTFSREERWWSQGHGSLIDTPAGEWYMVYHGYLRGFHTLGRQTLLRPVEWTANGWFRIAGDASWNAPLAVAGGEEARHGFPEFDAFDGDRLSLAWQCSGESRDRFRPGPGGLVAEGVPEAAERSPLLYMPAHESYEAEVDIAAQGEAEGRLLLYYDNNAYFGIGVSRRGVRHFRSFKNYGVVPYEGDVLRVRIRNDRHIVSFHYSTDGKHWRKYDKIVDASGFHHNTFGGFLSLRIGLDAIGDGTATFHRFRYRPEASKSSGEGLG